VRGEFLAVEVFIHEENVETNRIFLFNECLHLFVQTVLGFNFFLFTHHDILFISFISIVEQRGQLDLVKLSNIFGECWWEKIVVYDSADVSPVLEGLDLLGYV